MSLTVLLLNLTPLHAGEGDETCNEASTEIDLPGAHYVPTVGRVVRDISAYCDYSSGGDCESWDQVLEIYADSTPAEKDRALLVCAEGSDFAYRWYNTPWHDGSEYYTYFNDAGFLSGYYAFSGGRSFCCEGITTWHFYVGDPYATCIEPTDTGDADTADTSKTGPCGGGGGAAAALFAACSLLTARRRRQP
jgi:hypothetical protein